MGKIKRIIGLVLALAMVLGVIPFNAIEVKAKSQTYTTLQTNDYEKHKYYKKIWPLYNIYRKKYNK